MESAVNQAIDQANQANNAMNWYFLILFVIAPIAFALICIPVAIIVQHRLKCPKCGNWRRNRSSGVQTVKTVDGGKTTLTTHRVVICRKCKNEFTI